MLGESYRLIRDGQRRISVASSTNSEAMAETGRAFKLGFLAGDDAARSPRGFAGGAVGLGIVAALSAAEGVRRSASPPRTEPIPIVSAARPRGRPLPVSPEEELSESYTCVISHVGGNPVRKRVYLSDGSELDGSGGNYEPTPRMGPAPPPEDFLSRCYLCRKNLSGLDIFMYRGEKAFCSVECRCQQILNDEIWEKCGSEALKHYDCSVSPRSTPLVFTAGLAAA